MHEYRIYVRAIRMICRAVFMNDTSLVFFLKATLCSQSLAARCDVSYPVIKVFGKLGAFDLHTERKLVKRMLKEKKN